MKVKNVLLVGAGNIARTHAAALLETPGVRLYGVFDANVTAAKSLAKDFQIPEVFATLDDAANSASDSVHVLTPPNLHYLTALPFVKAGKAVLIEKPLGVSSQECAALANEASISGAIVGVNQNFCFNPAYLRLKQAIESGRLGRPRFLSYLYEVPLRQLAARQFSHWMFQQPLNILLEQAVHPLSQVVDLAGQVQELQALTETPLEISPGVPLHTALQASLRCERMSAHLRFKVGAQFTVCRISVVCDDGMAVADVFANQFHEITRTAYMEPMDAWLSSRATARQITSQGFAVLRDYVLAMAKLKPRSDAFFVGMKGSIQAFYRELEEFGRPRIDIEFGASLVSVCERIAEGFKPLVVGDQSSDGCVAPSGPIVALLGGTGFIGSHTVAALLDAGYRVRVIARGTRNLQAVFGRPGVEVLAGDVKSRRDLERVLEGADYAINLAHGGGGSSFDSIRSAMVDSAVQVAEVAKAKGIRRLVHVGSISSLYLGNARAVIRDDTPTDPLPHTRNDYARAKALADVAVMDACERLDLSFVLLRPGVVMGQGTSPFHGGLGFFNNDQYCIGWNEGSNPLPWVLVGDCAKAVVAALTAEAAVGKTYNLVGDVRPSAREFIANLSRSLGRPLCFVPSRPMLLWLTEMGKWLIKRTTGRSVPRPYLRDIRSRGLVARFDCNAAKDDLGWRPVSDAVEFQRQAVVVHGEGYAP